MKRVLTAVVLIPVVLLLIFRAPPLLLALVLGGIACVCAVEFVEIARGHGLRPSKRLLSGLLLLFFLIPALSPLMYRDTDTLILLLIVPSVLLIGTCARGNLREALPDAAVSLFGFLYVGGGLLSVWLLWTRSFPLGGVFVFYLLLVVWSGDISAYYVGTYAGRRKLAPAISPNKTWEGAIASFVVATGLGSTILFNLHPLYDRLVAYRVLALPLGWGDGLPLYPVWFSLIVSAIVNLAAQIGDLTESAMKRGANLKDSGTILPGHGGMLDRIDALLFAGPVAVLVFAVFDVMRISVPR